MVFSLSTERASLIGCRFSSRSDREAGALGVAVFLGKWHLGDVNANTVELAEALTGQNVFGGTGSDDGAVAH